MVLNSIYYQPAFPKKCPKKSTNFNTFVTKMIGCQGPKFAEYPRPTFIAVSERRCFFAKVNQLKRFSLPCSERILCTEGMFFLPLHI